jgi:radical SAM superfamily enzyme YgiQ (UPF0313 family)
MRPTVILYNPRCVFYTMPLALVAIASALDRARVDVRVIDGRLEADPAGSLLRALDGHVVCLGITVLTGAPIEDALFVSRLVKARRPELPIVWGGWHPSLFPEDTLGEPSIDAVVAGQGEETFAELVTRLAAREPLDGVAGATIRSAGAIVGNPPRPMRDVNLFPPHDYTLVDLERFFALKGRRQLDYVSSQGCRFRCTFCADPFVYKRGWYGLEPERVASELSALERAHGVTDVAFQDETFFTSPRRVAAIASALLDRGTRFTWTATMRADQGCRLDEETIELCRRSGLRRVIVGVESGAQEMLDWMKKDIGRDQVFAAADRCRRAGIGALFNLIVGFPDETDESVEETLRTARELSSMSRTFEIAIFYYRPYPGSEIADRLVRSGHAFPRSLEEWAAFDYVGASGPWVSRQRRARVDRFRFYQHVGWARTSALRAPLQAVARWRCERGYYGFPIEKALVELVRPAPRLS